MVCIECLKSRLKKPNIDLLMSHDTHGVSSVTLFKHLFILINNFTSFLFLAGRLKINSEFKRFKDESNPKTIEDVSDV